MDPGDDDPLSGDLKLVASTLFLGHYTEHELREALRARGFWKDLEALGFPDADVTLEPSETGPRAIVRSRGRELGELRASLTPWRGRRAIVIDWLEMRHPSAGFHRERPQLPGQRAPGLGLGRRMVELLIAAAGVVGADAIVVRPQHYHNAVLYTRIGFRYADPGIAARFAGLQRALAGRTLADASWTVDRSAVLDPATSRPVQWSDLAGDMVMDLRG